jgi:hypothetical protein
MSFFKKSPPPINPVNIENEFYLWMRPSKLDKARRLLDEISRWIDTGDRKLESAHWKVLQDYTAEMIEDLKKVPAIDLKTGKSVFVYSHELNDSRYTAEK